MNTIRELKQQEKYKNMLKRKNKEKKIYKDKNASLQFEKQKLYIALLNREKEIERLNNKVEELMTLYTTERNVKEDYKAIIKEVREYIMSKLITEWDIKNDGYVSGSDLPADAITPILEILDKENKQ